MFDDVKFLCGEWRHQHDKYDYWHSILRVHYDIKEYPSPDDILKLRKIIKNDIDVEIYCLNVLGRLINNNITFDPNTVVLPLCTKINNQGEEETRECVDCPLEQFSNDCVLPTHESKYQILMSALHDTDKTRKLVALAEYTKLVLDVRRQMFAEKRDKNKPKTKPEANIVEEPLAKIESGRVIVKLTNVLVNKHKWVKIDIDGLTDIKNLPFGYRKTNPHYIYSQDEYLHLFDENCNIKFSLQYNPSKGLCLNEENVDAFIDLLTKCVENERKYNKMCDEWVKADEVVIML